MSDKSSNISAQLAQLNELVAWFEGDKFKLDEALEKFAEAEKVAKGIEKELSEFKNKINLIKKDFGSEV